MMTSQNVYQPAYPDISNTTANYVGSFLSVTSNGEELLSKMIRKFGNDGHLIKKIIDKFTTMTMLTSDEANTIQQCLDLITRKS